MVSYLKSNFMLQNQTAIYLYEEFARDLPIIDYHCHLDPQMIYENYQFKNIAEIWLGGDHYKWRAMRANGVEESLITGSASDYDKFLAWAKTVPMTLGNPLYQWSHLELQRYFGIDDLLNEHTAQDIWTRANKLLASESYRVRDLITRSNVQVICTTDDPVDSLEYHLKLKEDENFDVAVIPCFRPDKALDIRRDIFLSWVKRLEAVVGYPISEYDDLLQALTARAEHFHAVGCRLSDHALDIVPYVPTSPDEVSSIFERALRGEPLSDIDVNKYKTFTILYLGKLYARLGWTMQFHMHAMRNNNARMFRNLGPDTGYDSMYDGPIAAPLCSLLNDLDEDDSLPKTILYSLNPKDYPVLAALIGSFQGGGVPGKVQFGAAWWFNDTRDGMLDQMKTLANMGLLSRFVGMLTDSRSFLSYPRHEYFRRLVCNMLGEWVEAGDVPDDPSLLGTFVRRICYDNAREYFAFA